MEAGTAEGQGFRRKRAKSCRQLGKAGLPVFGYKDLPIRPAAVFKDTLRQPRGVSRGIDFIPVYVPEKVAGEGVYLSQG